MNRTRLSRNRPLDLRLTPFGIRVWALVMALILPHFIVPVGAVSDPDSQPPQDAVQQCVPGAVLDERTGDCVREERFFFQRGSTEEPTRVEPTTVPRPTPEPVRPTAIPVRPTEPNRPTFIAEPATERPMEQPQPVQPTPTAGNNVVETTLFAVIPYDCVTTKTTFVDWNDAAQSCSQQTAGGVGFTLTHSTTTMYDVAEFWKGTSAPTALFSQVPLGEFTLERDPPATAITRSDVWCSERTPGPPWGQWSPIQLMPLTPGGTLTATLTQPDMYMCWWMNVKVDASLTLAPATVPVLIPRNIPQLVPICDPEMVLTDLAPQCVPVLPEEFETMQLCSSDPGFGDQSSNCELDVVVINESYWLHGSTIQVIPIICAELAPGWETIDDVYAGCVDATSATGWGFHLTINGHVSHATSLPDPVHGSLVTWHAVPEGDFAIAQDFVPNDVETAAFCSWEAQNTEAEELEYVVSYDQLMPVREGGAGSFSGSIDFPGTDYLCVWFNFPEPERFQP